MVWELYASSEEEWRSYTPGKRWRLQNKEKTKALQKKWRRDNLAYDKIRQRAHQLKSKYGITETDYLEILQEQRGVCKICGTTKVGGKWKVFHIDHDHQTGKIRGLLCTNCNRGLGLLGDTFESIEKAYLYMKNNQ